ncbi:MAG: hypothetical protein JW384_00924 [Nitrosomonadaceae bacterium]|nr:hypothetical protein [Nitrosomonadaceae bacterium]
MRRLPIFLLIDVSESMVGQNLYSLEEGVASILSALRKDPYALDSVYVSVQVFAGKARTILPLTDLMSVTAPELPVGGGTALGSALTHLMDEMQKVVIQSTAERKGDWKPIVFLLTDGHPTDDVTGSISRWNEKFRGRAHLVAVSIGDGADLEVLKRLTDDVLIFSDAEPSSFSKFITWISMSIQSHSRSVQGGEQARVQLSKSDGNVVKRFEESAHASGTAGVDDRYAVFLAKCSSTKLPYLVKFERGFGSVGSSDPALSEMFRPKRYSLVCAVPVKNSYFELTGDQLSGQTVSSSELLGQPQCPHCNAPYGMATCGCGGIHCIKSGGENTCPWCGNVGMYGAIEAGGSIDLNRGRG